MGKRSTFPRRERDFYPTPEAAVVPLVRHLPQGSPVSFWEPCAGDGALIRGLARQWRWGTCTKATDIEPQAEFIVRQDLFDVTECLPSLIITNPMWPHRRGQPTIDTIKHLAALRPTWLLLSADFAHNAYFNEVSMLCDKIVSVGRVSWMDNGVSGKENSCWMLFDANNIGATRFFGRAA